MYIVIREQLLLNIIMYEVIHKIREHRPSKTVITKI